MIRSVLSGAACTSGAHARVQPRAATTTRLLEIDRMMHVLLAMERHRIVDQLCRRTPSCKRQRIHGCTSLPVPRLNVLRTRCDHELTRAGEETAGTPLYSCRELNRPWPRHDLFWRRTR